MNAEQKSYNLAENLNLTEHQRREIEAALEEFAHDDTAGMIEQFCRDLNAAHDEIVKAQGGDPAAFDWPEWSAPANSIRWAEQRLGRPLSKISNGRWRCSLPTGHEGCHEDRGPNGGCVGWAPDPTPSLEQIAEQLAELEQHLEANEMDANRTAWGADVVRQALSILSSAVAEKERERKDYESRCEVEFRRAERWEAAARDEAGKRQQTEAELATLRQQLDVLVKQLVALFEWSDPSYLHATMHVENAVRNLRADLSVARQQLAEAQRQRDAALEAWLVMKECRNIEAEDATQWRKQYEQAESALREAEARAFQSALAIVKAWADRYDDPGDVTVQELIDQLEATRHA